MAEAPVESGLALDVAADPLVIKARREIIEHCLYGVDINEMAVEMAKLSLWLVSMDPYRPFTFLDDRLATGDSLLGITSIDQLEWMHLDVKAGRKLHEGTLLDFMSGVRSLLAEVTEQRVNLTNLPDDTFADLTKKRQVLADVQAKTKQLTLYADLIVGAALASSGKGGLWLTAAKLANEVATQDAIKEAKEKAKDGWPPTNPMAPSTGIPFTGRWFSLRSLTPPGQRSRLRRHNRQPSVPGWIEAHRAPRHCLPGISHETAIAQWNSRRRPCDLIAYFLLRAQLLDKVAKQVLSQPILLLKAILARWAWTKLWLLANESDRQSRVDLGPRRARCLSTLQFGLVALRSMPVRKACRRRTC